MRRIGDLMKDLGFNKEAPESTQKAFIKHLVNAANVSQFQRKSKPLATQPEQLSFNFEIEIESEIEEKTSTQIPDKKTAG